MAHKSFGNRDQPMLPVPPANLPVYAPMTLSLGSAFTLPLLPPISLPDVATDYANLVCSLSSNFSCFVSMTVKSMQNLPDPSGLYKQEPYERKRKRQHSSEEGVVDDEEGYSQ